MNQNPQFTFTGIRSGAWHLLPHDLPAWRTVSHSFWLGRRTGPWQEVHDQLRELVRRSVERNPGPSAAVLDRPWVKTTEQGGVRGYEGGKQISSRKRKIV